MKLELNTNGAWRTVLRDLTADQADEARKAADRLCDLARATGSKIGWRLVDGERAVTHIDSNVGVWVTR